MARKGKEPAGLRRYRLAQKRKKSGGRKRTVRAAPRRRASSMARRRRGKRKGRKKDKSIPVLTVLGGLAPAMPTLSALAAGGDIKATPGQLLYAYTGYNVDTQVWTSDRAMKSATVIIVGAVGSKIATKLGVNKHIKKLSMGYLRL